MNKQQLPLFDRVTSIKAEGYRRLAAFKFNEAEQYFGDARHAEQRDEEEITQALHACVYWQALIKQNKENPDTCSTHKLHDELRRYPFGNVPGLHQLKKTLLEYVANRLITDGQFYIDGSGSLTTADLLIELRHYKKAEKIVLQRIKKYPEENRPGYILAQIQWLSGLKGQAKINYARALLHDPCRVPNHRILFEPLQKLIMDVGTEMAPSFGWVRGVLPLVPITNLQKICSESHRRAIVCYRLLKSADRALKKRDMDACVEYRKNLKAEAPKLYDEYFALLSGRHK